MTTLPFFLGGQSLGGALSLMIGMRIKADESRAAAAARFVGVMVNCPAIRGMYASYDMPAMFALF